MDPVLIPVGALLVGMLLFAVFILLVGKSPLDVFWTMYQGGFGSSFSLQTTLVLAAPLILTGLAVAIPAQAGMVIIGGEGALAVGALMAGIVGYALRDSPALVAQFGMLGVGALTGAFWFALSGWLRNYRGVNETISSLLLSYIGIALLNYCIQGPLRDPASTNNPATRPIGDAHMIGNIPGLEVHYGLVIGIVCALIVWAVMRFTTVGLALRAVGGNPRAAQMAGLNVNFWVIGAAAVGGAAAGLSGAIEVAAVHGDANSAIVAGYGFTGILVAFIARQNPFAVIFVAIMFGGIDAAGGMLQRRLDMPDATVVVFQGILFVVILASDTLLGRFRFLKPVTTAKPVIAKSTVEEPTS